MFCVATADDGLWVTTDGGGLVTASKLRQAAAAAGSAVTSPVTLPLPRVSAATVYAQAGQSATITEQFRGDVGTLHDATAKVTVTSPTGHQVTSTVSIGLNDYYWLTLPDVVAGITTLRFQPVGPVGVPAVTMHVHGYIGPAPQITALSAHAGSSTGGNTITISGSNFRGVTGVYFGSRKARSVVVLSATRLRVRTPDGNGGQFVSVVTAKGGPSPLTGTAIYNFLP
jgi:hypothetical protein